MRAFASASLLRRLLAPALAGALLAFSLSPASAQPSDYFSLANWKLTLPVSEDGNATADEVTNPTLGMYERVPYFHDNTGTGVTFNAPAGGATTPGSSHPRTELREMPGGVETTWNPNNGQRHVMTIRQKITQVPGTKDVVAGQIHGHTVGDVLQIRYGNPSRQLVAYFGTSGVSFPLTPVNGYSLGDWFTVVIEATGQGVVVRYDGTEKVNFSPANAGTTWYFKAGVYTQSAVTSDGAGEVVIDQLTVQHITIPTPTSPPPTNAPPPLPPPAPVYYCAGLVANIVGTGNGEVLHGTEGADVIVAGGGDDVVVARGGDDVVCGEAGNDTLRGDLGNDRLFGHDGVDRLVGGAGKRDYCDGGVAKDKAKKCEKRVGI